MADDPTQTTPPPKQEEKQEELRYSVEELTESARTRLGVSPHAVAGAFAGVRTKTFTIDEAKARVAKFEKARDTTEATKPEDEA